MLAFDFLCFLSVSVRIDVPGEGRSSGPVTRISQHILSMAGLYERVLHPAVVDYTLNRFEEEFAKALAARHQGDVDLRRQPAGLERSMANQLRGLSDGYSPAITAEIAKLERQLAAGRELLKAADPQTVKLQMRDTRRFVEDRVRDLSALWL